MGWWKMKNKGKLIGLIACVMCMVFAVPCLSEHAYATTVLETDVAEPSEDCVMLGVYGSYYSQAQEALERINEIRREACEAGDVPDPRDESRMLEPGDYVPIKWSRDLESVARIRAVEGGLAINHARFNGKNWSSVAFNGISSQAEVLAFNHGTDMVSGIEQWYAEKEAWVNQVSGAVTGHYTSMINPKYTYVGLGDFYTKAAVYPNTLAGEFNSSSAELDQMMQAAATDVMQKIEVKSSYITDYILEGETALSTDGSAGLTLKATVDTGSVTRKLWVLDEVTYTSSNPSVAMVDSEGLVTGLKNGTATITVKKGGAALTTAEITVKCNHVKKLKSEMLPTCTSTGWKVYECETCGDNVKEEIPATPHAYVYGEADADGYRTGTCDVCKDVISIIPPTKFSLYWNADGMGGFSTLFPEKLSVGANLYCWISDVNGDSNYQDMVIESTDESVISVPQVVRPNSSQNHLKVLKAGITTITVYPRYNASYKRQVVARVGDTGSVDLSSAKTILSQTTFEYDGSAWAPSVTVSYRGTVLEKGTDYTLTFENNKEIGTAFAVITGKGIFSGSIRREFRIVHTHNYVDGRCEKCGDLKSVNSDVFAYKLLENGQKFCVSVSVKDGVVLSGTVNIPSSIVVDGQVYQVTAIEEKAFYGQSQIKALTIPDTVTQVNGQAFAQCGNLEGVMFFGKVAPSLGDGVFEGCSNVEIIVSEDAVGFEALAEKAGVTWRVEHIHDLSYHEKVEATCVVNGNVAYYSCNECGKMYADEFGNASISKEDMVIAAPGHRWETGYTIDLPATDTTNGSKSIHCMKCNAVKSQTVIPATGTAVGTRFKKSGMTYQVVKSDAANRGVAVSCIKINSKKVKTAKIPDTVMYKGVKYQVESIGKNAFSGCKKLKSVTIGKNVKSIGKSAFFGCRNLKRITIRTKALKTAKIGKNAFKGISGNVTIKVPKKYVKAYKKMLRKKGVSAKANYKGV